MIKTKYPCAHWTISWSATSTPSHSFSTVTMEHIGLLNILPELPQTEPCTYLSGPINCQPALRRLPQVTKRFLLWMLWLQGLAQLYVPTISLSKRRLRLRYCSGRWKALQKSPGKSWAMKATPVSADMVIKAPAASRSLTLKKQQWECARQSGNFSLARQNQGELRLKVQPFLSTPGESPTSQFSNRILHPLGIQPVLCSKVIHQICFWWPVFISASLTH